MADYHLGKVSIRPRGTYTSNTTYNFLDAVQDRGGTWLSLAASKDIEPGVTSGWQSYWMALAQGIQSVEITSPATGKATITVTYSNGTSTSTTIDTAAIPAGGVGTNELAEGSVITSKIADGSVTRAKLVPDALCSPVVVSPDSGEVNISLADAGATFLARWTAAQSTTTYVLNETISGTLPERFEIAFVDAWEAHRTLIKTSGVRVVLDGGSSPPGAPQAQNFKISETVGMVALKKLYRSDSGDLWILTGPAEVVT